MSSDRGIRGRWKSFEIGAEPPKSEPAAENDAAEDGTLASEKTGTFIGTGALFQGTLRLTGDFAIDSDFQGSLNTDGCLTVGPSGSVEGDINAREVIVEGAVVGNIAARRQLIVRANARLHGDIETACLEIDRYAFFNGRTTMTRPQADSRPTPPAGEKAKANTRASAPPA
jgi:cytoskeletal protein CcmA (bactofilin family)